MSGNKVGQSGKSAFVEQAGHSAVCSLAEEIETIRRNLVVPRLPAASEASRLFLFSNFGNQEG